MKIFCDTNILLEFIQQRKYAQATEQVLDFAESRGHSLYISVGSFYTTTYLAERYLKEEHLDKKERIEKLRSIMNAILDLFFLTRQSPNAVLEGVNDELFLDLEDSYQAHAAMEEGCDVILTIDVKHYAKLAATGAIEVLSPNGFIEKYRL